MEQRSQNFDVWQWIVPSAHAASCSITTLSGKQIPISDREGCIDALISAFYAQTIGIVANRQQFEEGLMNGVKGQSQEFIDLFSDPAGMAKSLTNIAWEIAEDPVAAGLKYGFNTADALSESSALYLKALANNDYVSAGEYMGRFAMNVAIALGTAEVGSAIEGAVFGAREAAALKAVEQVQKRTGAGTVWEKIKPTASNIPGTSIPATFEIKASEYSFWVNANATEHFGEYLTRMGVSGNPISSQAMLTSFQGAVDEIVQHGNPVLGQVYDAGGWEIIFRQNSTDRFPVIVHAKPTQITGK